MKLGGAARWVVHFAACCWLNVQVYTLTILLAVLFGAIGLSYVGMHRLITRNDRANRRLIRRSISWFGACVIRTGWPWVKVRFVDRQPDAKPPLVFVANHPASTDAFLMAVLPLEAVQVLNIWPAHLPVVGFLANLAQYLKPREWPFDEFLACGSRLLSQGVSVIAFPEGTRSGYGPTGNFHGSAFRLAIGNRTPIVPLVIDGNQGIPPKGSFWFRPGRITITKLPAVTAEEYQSMSPYQLKTMVREQIIGMLRASPGNPGESRVSVPPQRKSE